MGAFLWILGMSPALLSAANWPQFRGPNANGVATGSVPLPDQIDLERHVLWKVPMASGKSSPVIFDDRIYLTAFRDKKLLTIALDCGAGAIRWEREVPYEKLEEHHRRSSPAVASVATDGSHVVSFFGSFGLVCHDTRGRELWRKPMGPFNDPQGAASSPIIADGKVFLERDQDTDSFIAAYIDQFDRDASGALDETEYESIRAIYRSVRHVAMAIRPGGSGDITGTHVKWTQDRMIPRNASPVVHNGHLFMVRDGGILTSLDIADGRIVKSERLQDGTGSYFSSPVIGDGKIFLFSDRGRLGVVTAVGDWRQLGSTDFDEEVLATPAIVDGRICVRTAAHLYCLGLRN